MVLTCFPRLHPRGSSVFPVRRNCVLVMCYSLFVLWNPFICDNAAYDKAAWLLHCVILECFYAIIQELTPRRFAMYKYICMREARDASRHAVVVAATSLQQSKDPAALCDSFVHAMKLFLSVRVNGRVSQYQAHGGACPFSMPGFLVVLGAQARGIYVLLIFVELLLYQQCACMT